MQASDTIANLKAKILAELHAGCEDLAGDGDGSFEVYHVEKTTLLAGDGETQLDNGRTLGDCGVQAGAVLRIQ